MFMSIVWMCHVAVFCIFLYKAMWSTAHRYNSSGAGHSVALKQFSPSSCIQELMRKETYLLTKNCYTKHIYTALMLYTERRGIKKYERSMIYLSTGCTSVVLEHYCSCDGLLQWNLSWREPVLKGTCLERPPKNSLNKQFIPTKYIHVFLWLVLSKKRCDIISHWGKKGEAKKVQVTERFKGVKLLWDQEEKIYQQDCIKL